MLNKATLMLCVVLLATNSSFAAELSDARIDKLNAQIAALTQRVSELEAADQPSGITSEQAELITANRKSNDNSSWAQHISIKGDFRYRMEKIDQERASKRNRQRVRARSAIIAKVRDDLEIGLGFASGGDDPVSTNQTLGGGGSTKGLNMDLAYFGWTGMNNTKITAGKFKNLLFKPGKNSLLWDGDWNPEGLGFGWNNAMAFANFLGTWIESDSKKSDTEFSYAAQAGFKTSFSSGVKLIAGMSYIDIGTRGKKPFFGDGFFGNSFNPVNNTYLFNYEEVEAFVDLSFYISKMPIRVFADYVKNLDAGQFDTGYSLGVVLGRARAKGEWSIAWNYRDIEADAVFGLLSDSDFGGGGSDAIGHILSGSYAVAKNWNANLTYFSNQIDANLGTKKDFDRLQLDLSFKY